jgi:dTMP kinase
MTIISGSQYPFSSGRGFVVIDGINGAGKSSLLSSLTPFLTSTSSRPLKFTREPGGTPLGKHIRSLFIDTQERLPINPLSEVYLFAADRAQHVSEVIVPALQAGELIFCDRYYYSSVAFQADGRGLDKELVLSTNQTAIQNTKPDLVLLLDLPVEDALKRSTKRNEAEATSDAFEEESRSFHERVRKGFRTLAEELPEPFYIIDANKTVEEITEQVKAILLSYLTVLNESSL